jgi:SOS-response transcriptional repressor LexA
MAYSLTSKQQTLLTFITGYINEHNGVGPSIKEMAVALGQNSQSNIHRMLDTLEIKGHIRRLKWTARAIELINQVNK